MTSVRVTFRAAPEERPEDTCPKCDHPVTQDIRSSRNCARCGLARVLFDRFAVKDEGGVSEALREAWRAVERRWSDPAAHERFLRKAAAAGSFAWSARRYRRAARDRGRAPVAREKLDRIHRMAQAALLVRAGAGGRDDRESAPYRRATALLLLLVFLMTASAAFALVRGPSKAESVSGELSAPIAFSRAEAVEPR